MKKVINGKLYDTETAKECGTWANACSWRDFNHMVETLYRKRTGEFFLHGEGGPMTKYAESCGQNSWSGGSRIIPLSVESARKWAEEHLDADEYAAIFGVPSECESVTLSAVVPPDLAARVRMAAAEREITLSAFIAEALEAYVK